MSKNADDCYFCGCHGKKKYEEAVDHFFGSPGRWGMRECEGCELLWIDPLPDSAVLSNAYATYYTHHDRNQGMSAGVFAGLRAATLKYFLGYGSHSDRGGPLLERLRHWLLFLVPPLRDAFRSEYLGLSAERLGRLLDVGCGGGEFLLKMRELGWEVEGVETDPVAAGKAVRDFGLLVHSSSLQDASLPSGYFDVITLNHVIEHVEDPVALIRECSRLLRRGGRLVLMTPNMQSLGHKFFKQYWRGLEFPRHLKIFSERSLLLCTSLSGFKSVELRTTSRMARLIFRDSARAFSRSSANRNTLLLNISGSRLAGILFQLLEQLLMSFGLKLLGEEIFYEGSKNDDFR